MVYNFCELVDINRFDKLMNSFYDITGIAYSLLDNNNNILARTGWQDICLKFHRNHPVTKKNCLESDCVIKEHLNNGDYFGYKCKNGLMDYAVPIIIGGNHLATIFFGQILHEKPDLNFFKNQAKKYNFNEKEYLKALDKVSIINKEKIKTIMTFYSMLAKMLAEQGLKEKKLLELNSDLNKKNQLINASLAGFALSDLTGKVLYVNPALEKMFGFFKEEIEGKHYTEFFTDMNEDVLKSLINNGKLENIRTGRRKNGTLFKVRQSASVIYNGNKKPFQIVASYIDITNENKTKKELEEKLSFISALIESIPNPVFYKDENLIIQQCNNAFEKMCGLPKLKIIGKNLNQLVHSNKFKKENNKIDIQLLKHGGNKVFETKVNFKNNNTFHVIINKSAFENNKGEITGIIGVIQDITDMKKIHSQAQKVTKFKNEILAIMSHEIRTPLSGIIGFSELLLKSLREDKNKNKDRIEFTGYIYNSARGLIEMLNNLLELSSMEAGRETNIINSKFNVKHMLNEIAKLLQDRITAQNNVIHIICNNEEIYSDALRIQQILFNLIGNAVKFTKNGKISIKVKKGVKNYIFSVNDNGIGIAKAKQKNIFEMFEQVDNGGMVRQYQGVGLGLCVCKKFVEALGGTIAIQSEPGKGSKFTVKIPIIDNIL